MQFRDLPYKNVHYHMIRYYIQCLCCLLFPSWSVCNNLILTNVLWKVIRCENSHNIFYPCIISSLFDTQCTVKNFVGWMSALFSMSGPFWPSFIFCRFAYILRSSVLLYFTSLGLAINIRLKHSSLILCQSCPNRPKQQHIKYPSSLVFHFDLYRQDSQINQKTKRQIISTWRNQLLYLHCYLSQKWPNRSTH